MKAYVVLATKGRPADIPVILSHMERQTLPPSHVVVVGTEEYDFGSARDVKIDTFDVSFMISSKPGLPIQRNVGVNKVLSFHPKGNDFFIAYFDDDFRPKDDWLEFAQKAFLEQDIVGMTGWVLADGINGPGISEEVAIEYLEGRLEPMAHSSKQRIGQELDSAYGCNMAFNGTVSRLYRFDERLPAYGWQEDRDYTGQANVVGKVLGIGECQGVHLGTKNGRVSGVKFGYSQIANPVFLARKGTMKWRASLKMIMNNIIANHVKTLKPESWVDRKGRAKGNWIALIDCVKGEIHPERIYFL